jgi:integrase
MPADGPFYLQPKRKWSYSDDLWFEARPIGWNMLEKRFKEMCKDAGLTGNFTNHSGRATSITRLYDAGVPEKSIMKRSGHRSIEGVRTYRREDASVNTLVSNVLSGASTSNSDSVLDIDDETLVNA